MSYTSVLRVSCNSNSNSELAGAETLAIFLVNLHMCFLAILVEVMPSLVGYTVLAQNFGLFTLS